MKKIMILGAGVYQLPLIKKARDLDLHTIVVSPQGPYPGISYADEFIEADTTDVENVLAHARRIDIDAVLTTGTDVAVPTIGKIVDELGLRGTSYGPSLISMDKTLMKKCLVDNNIATARYFEFHSSETSNAQKAAVEIGYPIMVKASDSSGSRGVIKVNNSCDFEAAFSTAAAHTRNNKVIVEQFLDGHEIGAQAVVIGDSVQAIYVHNDTVSAPPTTLVELASVIKAGVLFISGDTGPLHIAGALGTPVVGIYGPSNPERNGPWSSRDEVVSASGGCQCLKRYRNRGAVGLVRRCENSTWCLEDVTVRDVCAAVDRSLSGVFADA